MENNTDSSQDAEYIDLQDLQKSDGNSLNEYEEDREQENNNFEEEIVNQNPIQNMSFPNLTTVGILAKDYEDKAIYSEDEGIDDYKKGGYHPVFVGEVMIGRYVILQKLGWGHFSTVWLCKDIKYNTYVAIKVQKSAQHYLEAAFDEVEILQKAVKHASDQKWLDDLKKIYHGKKFKFDRDDCHVVQLLNAFIFTGPYGKHFCMVFEILGVNLLEIIKRYDYKGIPLPICRKMSRQVLLGLHYLHKYCGIIHTDLKPENVMICLDSNELNEIFDKGQLQQKKEFMLNIQEERKQIQLLIDGIKEKMEEDDKSEEIQQDQLENQEEQNGFIQNQIREIIIEPETANNTFLGSVDNQRLILTNEDFQIEFDRLVQEKNIVNENEKKTLKKKLKRKMKRDKRKANQRKGSVIILGEQTVESHHFLNNRRETIFIDEALLQKGQLSQDFSIKIADLGNGCWVHHHFQPEIQTRQYRSPEVILGINYNETADIWSFACMLFEMLTGEFLFDPKKERNFKKSEDHLALMQELLHKFPKNYSTIGTNTRRFVDETGNLKNIKNMNYMNLKDLLTNYHKVKESEAIALSDFLMPMLEIYPEKRSSALTMLNHYWLDMQTTQFFVTEEDMRQNTNAYNKSNLDTNHFHRVVNKEDFEADISGAEHEEEQVDEYFYTGDYEKEIKKFDRSFKQVYVGYADGIDIDHLDSTGNWQFQIQFIEQILQ